MKKDTAASRPRLDESWPESWKSSYKYDCLELWGDRSNRGYVYSYENRRDNAIHLVKEAVRPPARILDVAGAQGNFSIALAELGYDVTWNDLREELVDYVRLKQSGGSITFAPGNVFEAQFSEPFDLVLITEIIEHVAHPDEFLRKITTFVKPNGFVVMTTPLGSYFRNHLPRFSDYQNPSEFESVQFKPDADGHIFLLHVDELKELGRSAGLEIQEIRLANNPLTSGHIKLESVLKVLPKVVVQVIEKGTRVLPKPISRKLHRNVAVLYRKVA